MRKKLLFVDLTHPVPYDPESVREQAVGGTEASLMRTAELLAEAHDVCVAQKARKAPWAQHGFLNYQPLAVALKQFEADQVVVLRKFQALKPLRRRYPDAGLHLWLHTYKSHEYALKKPLLQRLGATLVGNSRTHRQHLDTLLNRSLVGKLLGLTGGPVPVRHCYNPIPVPKLTQPLRRDPNKLIFLSAPNKGLDQVVRAFQVVRQSLPDLRLYVANPGYRADAALSQKSGIVPLGALPHKEVMRHLAESLCVFYPQDSFSETFGLIYAEANALGVPVLGCDVGAAREILHPANPLVSANDYPAMVRLLRQWQVKPPMVAYREAFSARNVYRQWQRIFAISD